MTEKKANKKKQLLYTTIATTIILIIIVFLLIAGLTKLLINGSVYYKIEPRTEKIAEYTKSEESTCQVQHLEINLRSPPGENPTVRASA